MRAFATTLYIKFVPSNCISCCVMISEERLMQEIGRSLRGSLVTGNYLRNTLMIVAGLEPRSNGWLA